MAFFEWTDKFSVKIESIDNQHKKLVELLNEAHDALIENKDKDAISLIFNGLVDYTKEHFAYEEKIFNEYNYAENENHTSQHNKLAEKVLNLQKRLNSGEHIDLLEIFAFLLDWLQDHILDSDMKYSDFFVGKGLK